MSGTVSIIPGAWRAPFNIKRALDMRFETRGKPLLASGTIGIKSTLSK